MLVAGGRRLSLATVVVCSVLAVPGIGHAAPAADDTTLTGVPSAYIAGVGDRVLVRGKVTADDDRPVQLQTLVGRTWRAVDSDSTTGSFALRVPTSTAGVDTYRLYAPASGSREAATTTSFKVAIGEGDARAHAFLTSPPVRWNPCRTVRYRVNTQGAPEGALGDAKQAVAMTAAASGLKFTFMGTTKVVPGAKKTNDLDSSYPDDTDLVIAWSKPADTQWLKSRSSVLGVGGVYYDLTPQKVGKSSWFQAVQGYVVLNSTKSLPGGFGTGREVGELGTWGQVLLHEVGHTVGLDHPDLPDKAQIMYPETTYKDAAWGRGDLTALRKVGAVSGCFATPKGATAAGPVNAMRVGLGR